MDTINFVELPTHNLATSQRFFQNAFGMQMTAYGPSYACTTTGNVNVGLQADPEESTKAVLVVFEVDDLDATMLAVLAAGATITKPIFGFPGGRRFHFKDPSNNELAAMQVNKP